MAFTDGKSQSAEEVVALLAAALRTPLRNFDVAPRPCS
jgi:hypothetical protein